MTFLLAFLLMQAPSGANALLERGAQVFKQSCAVGYCHGSGGGANRAPALANRGFNQDYINRVTRNGKPGTAMPAFDGKLPEGDLEAVIAYVLSLNGGTATAAAQPSAPAASTAAAQEPMPGRDLFFDPARMPHCGTCHRMEDRGIAVGPNLAAKPPASGPSIRSVSTPEVRQAIVGMSPPFPALPVSADDGWTKLYDLTGPLPVMRTVGSSGLRLEDGKWSHAAVTRNYTDAELAQIAEYIRKIAGQ